VLLRRYWRGGRISWINVVRVVADDEFGLRLWVSDGFPFWRITDTTGRTLHDTPLDQMVEPKLTRHQWSGDTMIWMPDDRPYSVWWFWRDGAFDGWYGNLEDPYVRWADHGCAGVDTVDHALDLLIAADRQWQWKDREEFEQLTGHPMYWNEAQAARIRAAGDELVRLAESARFPFDGTWTGYRPDAGWTVPGLPAGADRPRAIPTQRQG
jgi:hypothetical protein